MHAKSVMNNIQISTILANGNNDSISPRFIQIVILLHRIDPPNEPHVDLLFLKSEY